MGRPAASAARDTRREILDAALDLFAERGFHATSMRALASVVGVRESALYHHFASKDLILEAVIAERAEVRAEVGERMLADLGDRPLGEILSRLADALIGLLETPRERKFLRIAVSLCSPQESPFRALLARPRRVFLALFAELQRSGRVRRDLDAETFMLHFIAPLLLASGAPWGGKGVLETPLKKFVRSHIAFMVRAAGGDAGGG